MKILILWEHYPLYLDYFYSKHPRLMNKLNFIEIRNKLLDDHYCWDGDLFLEMKNDSIDCEYFIINDYLSQTAWANEHNYFYNENNWEIDIAIQQIKCFNPEIIFTEFNILDRYKINFKDHAKRVVVWAGVKPQGPINKTNISVLITDQDDTLASQHKDFDKVIITYPGFNKKIIEKIGSVEKITDVLFIGSLTYQHKERIRILYELIKNNIDLEIYGLLHTKKLKNFKNRNLLNLVSINGIKKISNYAIGKLEGIDKKLDYITANSKPPIFGMDYYRKLAEAKIVLNVHIDSAGDYSGNMRMFEATGLGSCLLTDKKQRNNQFFNTKKDIVEFENIEELNSKIEELLKNPVQLNRIAKNGQRETLEVHTIERMYSDVKLAF